MFVGHLDHVLTVYSSMQQVTWKSPGSSTLQEEFRWNSREVITTIKWLHFWAKLEQELRGKIRIDVNRFCHDVKKGDNAYRERIRKFTARTTADAISDTISR